MTRRARGHHSDGSDGDGARRRARAWHRPRSITAQAHLRYSARCLDEPEHLLDLLLHATAAQLLRMLLLRRNVT